MAFPIRVLAASILPTLLFRFDIVFAQPIELHADIPELEAATAVWEECLNRQAPTVVAQAKSYKWFVVDLDKSCSGREAAVYRAFNGSLFELQTGTPEWERRSEAIERVVKSIRAKFSVGSEAWFTGQRGSMAVPRYFPNTGGEDCAQRIAARKLGNHNAVGKAFPANALQRDPLETTLQFQERMRARAASALAAIDHAQGKPVVYTNLPIYLQYSRTPFFPGQYDADNGLLSVSILDTFGYDPRDRDDVGSNMLSLRTDTIKGASYGAQNGFGASTTVTDYTSIVHHWQVANGGGKYKLTVDLPIAPAALRSQLTQLRLFILGELQEPYVKRRNVRYRLPTLKNPSNEAIDAVIVYAPLRCAAIFNAATGKVLMAGAIKVAALP